MGISIGSVVRPGEQTAWVVSGEPFLESLILRRFGYRNKGYFISEKRKKIETETNNIHIHAV